MKTHHFKTVVNSEGVITLSGLPTHKEVEVIVIYPEPHDLQAEMKRWFKEVQKEHCTAEGGGMPNGWGYRG